MLYVDERETVLAALEECLSRTKDAVRRQRLEAARAAIKDEMPISGVRDNRPLHLGECSCAPGACKNSRNNWGTSG